MTSGERGRASGPAPGGEPPPLLTVISGPSGVGKDAVMARLLEGGGFVRPVTMTARPPRPGEVDGVHYRFATRDQFEAAIAAGELLEHALVHGTHYGTPRASLRDALASGLDVLLQVDVQGARALHARRSTAPSSSSSPRRASPSSNAASAPAPPPTPRRSPAASPPPTRRCVSTKPSTPSVVNIEGDLDATVERVRALIGRERARPGRHPTAEKVFLVPTFEGLSTEFRGGAWRCEGAHVGGVRG